MKKQSGTFPRSGTLEVLAANVPIGIAIVNSQGEYRYINPKFREMFGYDLTDIPDGKSWFEKAYPDSEYRARVFQEWVNDFGLFKPGEKKPWIFTVACKDESVKTIRFMPVQLSSGEILIAYEDITQLAAAREELEEKEERNRNMFNNIPFPTFVYDFDTLKIVDVNTVAVRDYGYTRDELLKMTLEELTPEEDRGSLLIHLAKPDPSQERVHWRHCKKNGTIIDVEITGHALQFPGKNYRMFLANDVTEIRKAGAALQFTQFAVDHAAVGILWIAANGEIMYGNDAICRLTGYARQELATMNITEFEDSFLETARIVNSKSLERPGSENFQTVFKTREGALFPVEITCNYMDYAGNGYICAIIQDITQRKIIEESLKRREFELKIESSRLQEANTALKVLLKHRDDDKKELEGKLISNIKELVLPYIDKMKRGRLDPEQVSYVDIIETNLKDILSPFLQKMSMKYSNFTPTEIQVANLIKAGKTSKEIAEILNVATGTIDTHRNNIRSKLNLNNKKMNLRAYLISIS